MLPGVSVAQNTENEELVDVEDEEEDEDDSEFFDESSDDVLDEE